MTRQATTRSRVHVTGPVVAAVAGTIAIAAAAFTLSFTALHDLAVLAGIPPGQAWLWPLVVDGVILEATISVVALRDSATQAKRFAWLLPTSGAGISVAANITHAIVAADASVPAMVAALVASVPPLTLLAMTHLTVELIRHTPHPQPASPAHEEEPPASSRLPSTAVIPAEPTPPELHSHPGEDTTVALPGTGGGDEPTGGDAVAPVRDLSREERRRQAIELAATDASLSNREIARRVGAHPTTIGRWLAAPDPSETEERNDHDPHP